MQAIEINLKILILIFVDFASLIMIVIAQFYNFAIVTYLNKIIKKRDLMLVLVLLLLNFQFEFTECWRQLLLAANKRGWLPKAKILLKPWPKFHRWLKSNLENVFGVDFWSFGTTFDLIRKLNAIEHHSLVMNACPLISMTVEDLSDVEISWYDWL